VKCHRGRLMQKLGITSIPDLIHIVQKAEVPRPQAPTKV
jgi:FixJ family two-component response regulator